jgi:hypothetical protein
MLPRMAPFLGPDKRAVLRKLRGGSTSGFPLTLGVNQPQAVIQSEPGRWVLRTLVMDHAAADAAGRAALESGQSWMPEMAWRFLAPGPIVAEATTRATLADALERGEWPYDR